MREIKKIVSEWKKDLFFEVKSHPKIYYALGAVMLSALFLRVYRTTDLLGFYYDQGRDALVIWDLWHKGEPFLIGPVTGLAGIFLGPLYYYMIAPFYLIGGGHPALPAVFLATLSVIANLVIYYVGKELVDRPTGLIAAVVASFSYYVVLAGRWLANPTPILLASSLLFLSMVKISKGSSEKWWVAIALLVGASLQFEAASAVFYIPMVAFFAIWQRKKLPGVKIILASAGIFFLSLLPQIVFNFRHDGILFDNFRKVILEERSFRLPFLDVAKERADFFWTVFASKVFPENYHLAAIFGTISILSVYKNRNKLDKYALALFLLFLGTPVIGITLFQGNFGNIYDYYVTGYYLPMLLLFSLGFGLMLKNKLGKIITIVFLLSFLAINFNLSGKYLSKSVYKPTHITLGNELSAVNWIFNDAFDEGDFNVDVYVPPVIPYAYDYLFLWQGTKRCGSSLCGLVESREETLYTLYEVDPPHPWRLDTWLDKQASIGKVEEESVFGGITVQRRERLVD